VKDVNGKLILITGGASGIGRLMALTLARKGGRLVVWDLNGHAIKALAAEAAAEGISVTGMVCDISDRAAVYRRAKALIKKYGPVDILINNAGVVTGKPLLQLPDEKIEKTMQVNVLPLFWLAKAFLPAMIERNSGHIVTISSAGGLIGVRGLADYCTGKFGAVGFDESLRMELRHIKSSVKTTIVCPFFINTGMFEGVKTRIPLLLPILKSDYAVKKIVSAILKNKKRLIIPPFAGSVLFFRMFPVAVMDTLSDFFGLSNAMDNFSGNISKK